MQVSDVAALVGTVVTTAGGLVGLGVGISAWFGKLRKRWAEENHNVEALKKNTEAIDRLERSVTDLSRRIDTLESRK